jgi:hypothetical protein
MAHFIFDAKVSLCRLRYNTLSDGSNLCWRLILDGKEYLVNDIDVQVHSFTSKDWLEDKQEYKHHITMKDCRVAIDDKGIATISPA